MKVLVVGGAGYIGSHMVKALLGAGYQVAVLDNLSTGYADAVIGVELIEGDLADQAFVRGVLADGFEAVMHFASYIQVGESVHQPAKYYRNNVVHTQNLLDAMVECGVRRLVFSSTAAIFGEPVQVPIDEDHPKAPTNPYGRTKWMVEQMLGDYDRAYGLKSACLRYFNAAGADPEGQLGERHDPETHLIPLILQAASGRRPAISVFGTDYDTPDGTCIRDYIHVSDLCDAHLLALDWLQAGEKSAAFNLGNGQGFSVNEVIEASRRATGKEIPVTYAPRREGDPARLVADSTKIMRELGWRPRFGDLDSIVKHAWQWELRHSEWGKG